MKAEVQLRAARKDTFEIALEIYARLVSGGADDADDWWKENYDNDEGLDESLSELALFSFRAAAAFELVASQTDRVV